MELHSEMYPAGIVVGVQCAGTVAGHVRRAVAGHVGGAGFEM